MIVAHLILILMIGLSFIQGIHHKVQTVNNDPSEPLALDEAYLIVKNNNSSNNITLTGNSIVCEYCDLEEISTVPSNQNDTQIINTKYAYDLEVRLWSSNISSLCTFKSYKFDEHGTYVLDVTKVTSMTATCSIKQIGNLSNYWAPVVVGILLVVLYTVLVQVVHRLHYGGFFNRFRSNNAHQKLIKENIGSVEASRQNIQQETMNGLDAVVIGTTTNTNKLLLAGAKELPDKKTDNKRVLSKRLRGLDTFRGFSLMVMIFVNYGVTGPLLISGVKRTGLVPEMNVFCLFIGGGYWFFDHSVWNGLTLADLVFPWFTWMMGVSIVLSQRSLRSKNVSRRSILLKICRRTIILLILGFIGHSQLITLDNVRLPGVLRRLGICYFFTAIIVLVFDKKDNTRDLTRSPTDDDLKQPLRLELYKIVFQYWLEWIFVLLSVTIWLLITFLLPVPNCPTGYLGPGGKHQHGQYENCTGGAAGYVDQVILGPSHLYQAPTCKEIYDTKIPYDPEGILGHLTGILLCYLGAQAGHIFVHCTNVRRICINWLIWGIICGSLALVLSHGGHSDSWIPINKNLWSLTFVLSLASLAFFNLTVLYLVVDVYQYFTGAPFVWLGMNSIVIYICHSWFASTFPVQFAVGNTHAKQLAVHLYGAFFWSFVAGFLYYKRIFIAI